MNACKIYSWVLLPLALAACATPEKDAPASAQMQPAAMPTYSLGTVYHAWDMTTDKAVSAKVVAVEGDVVTFENSNGCRFAQKDPVLPVLSWENCGDNAAWRSGTRTYTAAQGSLWPLQVGNRASYETTWTTNDGKTDSGTLDCSVDGTAHIKVRAGEFDTYRVVCVQRWAGVSRRRVSYWTPDVGTVKFSDTHSKRGITDSWELVSVERT